MSTTSASAAAVSKPDEAYLRATLMNVADAIHNILLPELAGSARARAGECVTILARLALELQSDAARLDRHSGGDAAVLAAEGARLDAAEAAFSEAERKLQTENASHSSRTFDQQRFERYLQAHDLGGAGTRIVSSRQLAGGRSKQTILVEQAGARHLPAQLVVRQDWASAVTGTTVVTEFELLHRVWQAGIRVPQPLLLERSAEILGGAFLVVTRVDGGPKGDIFNPPRSEKLALQVADQLARLHALPTADFEALQVPTQAHAREQLQAGLQSFRGLHAQLGRPNHIVEMAMDWLEQHVDQVEGPRVLVHNDLGCHNFLISDDNDLTAILDWELAHIGNPAADLGYIRSWIEKMISWDGFIAAYERAGGQRPSSTTLDFYTLWCGVRLYSLLLQARAGVAMGAVRDTEITYACAQFIPQLLHRLSRELRAIASKA